MSDSPRDGEACVVSNIGKSGRRRRAVTGAIVLAATICAAAWWAPALSSRWMRIGAAPLLLFSFLCLIQAQEKT